MAERAGRAGRAAEAGRAGQAERAGLSVPSMLFDESKVKIVGRTADSGKGVMRAFCVGCGGTVGMWPGTDQNGSEREEREVREVKDAEQGWTAEARNGEGQEANVNGGEAKEGLPWFTVPAPNLVGFDWRKMMREDKQRVVHCWTKHAVVDVPEGYVQFEGQVPSG